MFPKLKITLEGSEPQIVQITQADMWTYEELSNGNTTEHGMRLTLAYCALEAEPKNLAQVKKWAREKNVMVEVEGTSEPFPSEALDD
jgi:hypothetical protein